MIGMSNGWASSNQKYCYQTLLNIEIDSFDHHHYLYIGIDDNVYGEHQSVIPGHTQLNSSSNRITPFCKDASVKNFPGNLLPNVFFFTLDVITFIIFFLKEWMNLYGIKNERGLSVIMVAYLELRINTNDNSPSPT